MNDKQRVHLSKFLSKHLRHEPEALGLTLAPGGWVEIDKLLAACHAIKMDITAEELGEIVAKDEKQRYSFDDTKKLIRANQGHSTPVDLQLETAIPPAVLYHGTGQKSVDAIKITGLLKMDRHHVHLSSDVETAHKVGSRHGKPVIFAVDAAAMVEAGYIFYRSENGVWLVDQVPAIFLSKVNDK